LTDWRTTISIEQPSAASFGCGVIPASPPGQPMGDQVNRMKISISIAAVLVASIALCGAAGAKENYKEKAFNADSKDKFEAVAADVRKEMESGGRYQYVKVDERTKIDAALTEMTALFATSASIASMNQDAKIKLFNDQEIVNSILQQRDGDRVICKKEAPIGSHIPVATCHTYAQEVEARSGASKQMSAWGQSNCSGTAASVKNNAGGGQPCVMHGNP
jgi:hypothetical protein